MAVKGIMLGDGIGAGEGRLWCSGIVDKECTCAGGHMMQMFRPGAVCVGGWSQDEGRLWEP